MPRKRRTGADRRDADLFRGSSGYRRARPEGRAARSWRRGGSRSPASPRQAACGRRDCGQALRGHHHRAGPGEKLTAAGRRELRRGGDRSLGLRIIEEFIGALRPTTVEAERSRIRQAGLERLHFAWAGSLEPHQPHYYRLHGPTLVIEYDNTQNEADHIHSVGHDAIRAAIARIAQPAR
jgi:hypothetical protein